MDDQQALAIVSALANGANPVTGEMFAADSPYQSPEVIRALFVARRALEARLSSAPNAPAEKVAHATPRAASAGTNAGKPWGSEEDKQLLAEFDADKPLAEIARIHSRTVNGVRARLEKHGRLEPSAATRWPREQSGHGGANSDRTKQPTSSAPYSSTPSRPA